VKKMYIKMLDFNLKTNAAISSDEQRLLHNNSNDKTAFL